MRKEVNQKRRYISQKLTILEILKYVFWMAFFTFLLVASVHLRISIDKIMAEAKRFQDKELQLAEECKKLKVEVEKLKQPSRILQIASEDLGMVRDDVNEKLMISSENLHYYRAVDMEKVERIKEEKGIGKFFLALLNINENAEAGDRE